MFAPCNENQAVATRGGMRTIGLVVLGLLTACVGEDNSLGEAVDTEGSGTADAGDAGDASGSNASVSATSAGEGTGDGDSGGGDDGVGSTDGGDDTSGGAQTDTGVGESDGGSGSDGSTTGQPPPGSAVLFVNFDGITLTAGTDDATNDTTSLGAMAHRAAAVRRRIDPRHPRRRR